jgi:hypothetical protein
LDHGAPPSPPKKPARGTTHRPPVLDQLPSQQLRDQLVAEIGGLKNGDDLAVWAHRRLPAKNTLMEADALLVEAAYQAILLVSQGDDQDAQEFATPSATTAPVEAAESAASYDSAPHLADGQTVTPMTKPIRRRNKAHLAFVAGQPCLICQRSPCDAHHLKFAQPNTLGRKVSDEFTVPLCRDHHHDLHRQGNEMAWWANLHVTPTDAARELWMTNPNNGPGPRRRNNTLSEPPQKLSAAASKSRSESNALASSK